MAETNFNVNNYGAVRVRLEPTGISADPAPSNPILKLSLNLHLQSLPGQQGLLSYSLIRLAGKFVLSPQEELLRFEAPPMAEPSSQQPQERQYEMPVPISLRQLKRIEEVRDGKDPQFQIFMTGLIALPNGQFEKLENHYPMTIKVPRSHWIDHVLNVLKISDLRLLEIAFPADGRKEIHVAKERLQKAEHLYRTGEYAQVLTTLRSAFTAIAECYSMKSADRNLFDKMLVNTHPEMKGKLRDAFDYLHRLLHAGPHEPTPTPEVPIPVSRQDARFALVTAHAVFEYFSSEGWPGI